MAKFLQTRTGVTVCVLASIVPILLAPWDTTPKITILIGVLFGLYCSSGWIARKFRVPRLQFFIYAAMSAALMAQTLYLPNITGVVRITLAAFFATVTALFVGVAAFWTRIDDGHADGTSGSTPELPRNNVDPSVK